MNQSLSYEEELIMENISKHKETKFKEYINLKTGLEQITHKKIVQIIFRQYLQITLEQHCYYMNFEENPQLRNLIAQQLKKSSIITSLILDLQKFNSDSNDNMTENEFINSFSQTLLHFTHLKALKLNLNCKFLGNNQQNCKQLFKNGIQRLKSLKNLYLILSLNNLFQNHQNVQFLAQALQNLQSLTSLSLNLSSNNSGQKSDPENVKSILKAINKLPNLESLSLDLSSNNYDENSENLYGFSDFKPSKTLKSLELKLFFNYLGENTKNLELLTLNFNSFALKSLILDLQDSQLGNDFNNLRYLSQALQFQSSSLINLQINLESNYLGKDVQNMEYLGKGLIDLKNLTNLDLNLGDNQLAEHKEGMVSLGNGFNGMTSLNKLKLNVDQNPQLSITQGSFIFLSRLIPLKNLEHLSLSLKYNNLGENIDQNMIMFGNLISQLNNLIYLDLNLRNNRLGYATQNISFLEGFKSFSCLQDLKLYLGSNNLGGKSENMDILKGVLRSITSMKKISLSLDDNVQQIFWGQDFLGLSSVTHIDVYLDENYLIDSDLNLEDFERMAEDQENSLQLKEIYISFQDNDFQDCESLVKNIEIFIKVMKKLSPSFSLLTIELYNTSIEYIDTETEDNLKDLGCVISI